MKELCDKKSFEQLPAIGYSSDYKVYQEDVSRKMASFDYKTASGVKLWQKAYDVNNGR